MKTVVLYHANCFDGITAAWVTWGALKEQKDVSYYPMKYNPDAIPLRSKMVAGDLYICVDYSLPRDIIEGFLAKGIRVTVLDHHKTANESLGDLVHPNFEFIYTEHKSGALIAWDWFHNEPAPPLVQHVSDRDLWQFKLEGSKEVHAYLCTLPKVMAEYEKLNVPGGIEFAKQQGALILQYHNELAAQFGEEVWFEEVDGHMEIPFVNVSMLFSEAPQRLLMIYDEAPFAGYVYHTADAIQVGLRGRGDVDVSEIAKKFGGGGHHNAAGFRLPKPKLFA